MLMNCLKSFERQSQQVKAVLRIQYLQQFCYTDNPTDKPEDGGQVNVTQSENGGENLSKDKSEQESKIKQLETNEKVVQSPEARKLMQHLTSQTESKSQAGGNRQEQEQEVTEKIKKGAKKFSILFGPSADYLQPFVKKPDQQQDSTFQDIQENMAHPETGYKDLGQSGQVGEDTEFSMSRIHPEKIFQPGDTYTPEDLNPFESAQDQRKRKEEEQKFLRKPRTPKITDADVKLKSSFTNIPFLINFMSETGKIVPQRISRLSKRYHRKVARNIKTARQMALMPPEGRPVIGLLDKATIARIQARQEAEQKLVTEK